MPGQEGPVFGTFFDIFSCLEGFLLHFSTLRRDSGCGAETKSENLAFSSHFQRVKSCGSVVSNIKIAFSEDSAKENRFRNYFDTDFGPLQAPEVLTIHYTPKGPPWHRKVASENGAGKTVTAGEFCQGGRGVGPQGRRGGAHVLRVIFKANPFEIELEKQELWAQSVAAVCLRLEDLSF